MENIKKEREDAEKEKYVKDAYYYLDISDTKKDAAYLIGISPRNKKFTEIYHNWLKEKEENETNCSNPTKISRC